MRLIDADALEREGWVMHRTYKSDAHTMTYEVKHPSDFPTIEDKPKGKDINVPTVDAIPVDWVVQRTNETSSGSGMNVELNHALFTVSVEWERWKKNMARMEVEECD